MAKKKPLSPEGLEAIVDGFLGAAARGDIRIGSWPVQGVERRLKSLELMIESCCHPNIKLYKKEYVDIAPGKVRIVAGARTKNPLWKATEDDIGNLEAGISHCRKMLDDLKDTPPKKVREKLAEIDKAIQALNNLEDSITTQQPYAKIQKGQRKGQAARVKESAKVRRKNTAANTETRKQDWEQHFLTKTRGVDDPRALTDKAIASKHGVDKRTVERWRKKWREQQGWKIPKRSQNQI